MNGYKLMQRLDELSKRVDQQEKTIQELKDKLTEFLNRPKPGRQKKEKPCAETQ